MAPKRSISTSSDEKPDTESSKIMSSQVNTSDDEIKPSPKKSKKNKTAGEDAKDQSVSMLW
jgi:hypothetical protein